MTMVLDNQGRHYGGAMGGYDHIYQNTMHQSPQFNDPWSHPTSSSPQAYAALNKSTDNRSSMTLPYAQLPPTSAPLTSGSGYSNAGYNSTGVLSMPQDIPRSSFTSQHYSSPANSASQYSTSYQPSLYSQQLQQQQQQQQQRKLSDNADNSRAAHASYTELDASRGMLALSHSNMDDMTPRNIFDVRAQRGSTDAYGFPPTQSGHSSISNESGRGYPYYASSVASVSDSNTDYSSAASDAGYDPMTSSRTLPRPQQLIGASLGAPPAPSTMMGQFSSKLSANTQKKHKCKVCDKRFTRPSSLQTHMYSHTGEKPFQCPVVGCGRNFSVVSNLRRHKKVHKGDGASTNSDVED